jgi:cell division protein FtsI (penicillin-binding protein 3)
MATQLRVSHLIADPQKIIDPDNVAFQISSLFPDIDAQKLLKGLSNKKSRYFLIKRNVIPSEQQMLHDMGIPGIDFETSQTRYYPQENLASHIIGLTDTDMHGVAGVERYFQEYLTNVNNTDLQLSVDLRIQYILKSALRKSIKTFNALGGSALVMDIKTGEILGMVSMPDFNPNNRATLNDITKFNRASVGAYEPGSVFKIINTAIALETKTSDLSSMYDVSKSVGIGRHRINDFHNYNGSLSVADIMRKSSNRGSVRMAERFGPHVQEYYFRKLGLFSPQNLELSEKGQSITGAISRIRMMTMSFGHGISVTPLQLASAISTVVNGGYYIEPTLIKNKHQKSQTPNGLDNKSKVTADILSSWADDWRLNINNNRPYFNRMKAVNLKSVSATHGEQIFSKKTSDLVRYTMRLVCEVGGSGTQADVYGFPVMGKTGTAEKTSATGGYNKKSLISSFAGVFPAHDPQYIVYTMIDEPKPNVKISRYATGGVVAAPIIKQVVEHIAPLLNIKPLHYPQTPHAVSENMLDKEYSHDLEKIKLR